MVSEVDKVKNIDDKMKVAKVLQDFRDDLRSEANLLNNLSWAVEYYIRAVDSLYTLDLDDC